LIHFGETAESAGLTVVASLGRNHETAVDALAQLNRYSALGADVDTDGRDRMELVRRDRSLWLVDRRSNPNAFPELTGSTFAGIVCGARRRGFDVVRELSLTQPLPSYADQYERIFQVPKTLHRRLRDEGITFGAIFDAVRYGVAISYLEDGVSKLDDIAEQLGFSDQAVFSKAFRRWAGRSPRARDTNDQYSET
jgi:AraC-like DNA-binding protein